MLSWPPSENKTKERLKTINSDEDYKVRYTDEPGWGNPIIGMDKVGEKKEKERKIHEKEEEEKWLANNWKEHKEGMIFVANFLAAISTHYKYFSNYVSCSPTYGC